jgi:6-phosphofructokinase 1
VFELVSRNISHIVVIGGDGSLTGANLLRSEWSQHLSSLLAEGKIDLQQSLHCSTLSLVGLVGSIDNDMYGTDMTIGANTALERIIFAVGTI